MGKTIFILSAVIMAFHVWAGGCLENLTNRYIVEAKTAGGRLDLEQLKRTLARYHYELDPMQMPVGIGDNRFLLKALSLPRGGQTGEYEEIERLGFEIISDGKGWLHAKNSNFSSLKNAGISSFHELSQEYVVFSDAVSWEQAVRILGDLGIIYSWHQSAADGKWTAVVYISQKSREKLSKVPGFLNFEDIDFI